MGEVTGLDSMKNHPNTFPKHVGVGFGWSRDVQQDFHQFHDLNTATGTARFCDGDCGDGWYEIKTAR